MLGRRERVNRLLSNLLIIVIVGGSLTAVVLQKEFWPFSHFPMYSVTVDYREPAPWYALYGLVESNGDVSEVLLNGSRRLFPFNEEKLMQSLGYSKVAYKGRMWGSYMELSDEFYRRKLLGFLKLYNRNRDRAPESGKDPPLVGLRLCELESPHRIPGQARAKPKRVRVIAELSQGD